jgi:long-chain acyl-CoA synthetase
MDLLHSLTLGDVLREHARSHPARVALVDGDRRLTFPELDARVDQLANALIATGFAPGDRALWLGQNSFRVIEGLLGAARAGGCFCPANWRSSAAEMATAIDDLEPALILWQDDEIGDAVRAARDQCTWSTTWVQHDAEGDGSYEALLASGASGDPGVAVDPASPALLMFTAAFTGTPNAAMLSHTAVLVQDLVMGMMQEISCEYVYLNCGPLFHVATFMTTMATFHFGGTNVFTPRVDAEELCRLIEAERCTGAFVMGPTINEILELNRDSRFDLTSLRTFGGSPEWNEMITVDTSPWARRPAGFGQTEVMGMLTFNAWGGEQQGTVGRPSPMVQVRIVDPDDVEVPPGETGEIAARGPTVMNGYFGRDQVNAERLRNGWHHTNDLGRREADGSITFVGPKTRIIKSAAENIYPAEVEACLQSHPAVQEAAVIGVPDPKWDQSVKAVVVLTEGHDVTAEAIMEHCRANIASYKKPRTVEFVEKLPRDGWLVDYDALDEQFGGGGYPGARR